MSDAKPEVICYKCGAIGRFSRKRCGPGIRRPALRRRCLLEKTFSDLPERDGCALNVKQEVPLLEEYEELVAAGLVTKYSHIWMMDVEIVEITEKGLLALEDLQTLTWDGA